MALKKKNSKPSVKKPKKLDPGKANKGGKLKKEYPSLPKNIIQTNIEQRKTENKQIKPVNKLVIDKK
jgi:hypothetical protein